MPAASGDRMENGMMNGDEDFRSGSPGLQRSGSRNSIGRDGRNSLLRRNQSLSAKQIMFYRNGDRFFSGLKLAVSSERYKEFDSLLTELSAKIDLQTGAVRYIFNSETGNEVQDVTELQYGVSYVCSSSNHFQRIEGGYRNNQPQWALTSAKGNPKSELQNWQQNEQVDQQKDFIRAKLVTVVKHGKKPQKKVTMLLNKKTASSLNQVLDHLSSKVTVGKVDKLYTVDMKPIKTLRDLFYDDHTFVALSSHEKPPEEGFDLDLQQYSCKKNSAYRDLQRPSSGLKRSSSLRTTRQHRDSSSRDGGAPGRPVRRSSSVKSAGKGSRGRSVSPSRVNGHTPLSNRSKSPSSTGRKTPSGTGMGTDELYPAHVFEKDNMMSDSGGETKVFKKRRVSVHGFYRIGKVIGDGNFAVVRECKHRKTNKEYALKIINKAKVKGKEHMIENEISILRRVKHNHIVELIEEYETPREIFLVMELVKGGDLFEAIVEATKYTEVHASHMVRDLASALDYLHCNSIVHRDIKPENLLVLNLPNGRKSLKLADFGLAMEVKSPMFLVCGTPTYVAPEILDESGYGLKVDIWAAGVISYILLCGFPPFRSPDQDELFDLILAGEFEYLSPFWNDISSSAKDLIDHMLVVDANQRYSAKQVLAHPWVKGNTVAHKDIHVNLQNEINKNFDAKRRLRSAAVAVKTVKPLTKATYKARSHCCRYMATPTKPPTSRAAFDRQRLKLDIHSHSEGDLNDYSVYGGCSVGAHSDVALATSSSHIDRTTQGRPPERYKSSPEILSPEEKQRFSFDVSNLTQREPHRKMSDQRGAEFVRGDQTRQQVVRHRGARRPRSSSVQTYRPESRTNRPESRTNRTRKHSYDVKLETKYGSQHGARVKKLSVPDPSHHKLEDFVERDVIFSVQQKPEKRRTPSPVLSPRLKHLEARLDAENRLNNNKLGSQDSSDRSQINDAQMPKNTALYSENIIEPEFQSRLASGNQERLENPRVLLKGKTDQRDCTGTSEGDEGHGSRPDNSILKEQAQGEFDCSYGKSGCSSGTGPLPCDTHSTITYRQDQHGATGHLVDLPLDESEPGAPPASPVRSIVARLEEMVVRKQEKQS
ncbi:serine/threonine-protein kinase DCLK1 isoform X4 [Nematostella vectensis]|uniref:serine/threonine-protein kinase DCLK1 isoform X4 n=1 Tax=Nematostella vectensis TaxID=45351 RepID=UPI0013901066|nr:serine/threonine-protein kinase DCLK1 isoform X4 [Nematostella vectensis]